MSARRQLSLYVPPPEGLALDAVRCVLDPVQHALIPAHVTLCREDELSDMSIEMLAVRFSGHLAQRLTLRFGRPERFEGHGILMPCVEGESGFRALREYVLGSRGIRHPAPHLTLAHPRNPRAPGNALPDGAVLSEAVTLTFGSVNFIEQTESGPWRVLERFALHDP